MLFARIARYFVALMIVLTGCLPSQAAEFHVAPSGASSGDGTKAKPFPTLARARDAVRQLKKQGGLPKGGVTIYLHGGTYVLRETFLLTPEDSGEAGAPIVYAALGDKPAIITGERVIDGWKPLAAEIPHMAEAAKGKIWVADVPKGWRFHYLYADDKPQQVSRTPNDDNWQKWPVITSAGDPCPEGQLITFPPGSLQGVNGNGDVEMCFLPTHRWMNNLSVLKDVNPETSTARRHSKNVTYRGKPGDPFQIQNALPALDEPGEWCVDSSQGKVYYWPPTGNMNGVKTVAPGLVNLVRLQGKEEGGPWVHHVAFRGLTFQYSDRLGEDKWPDAWLKRNFENPDAAIFCQGVEDLAIEGCRVLYAGTYAVAMDHHALRSRIVGNQFGWLGCGGVQLYGYGPSTLDVNRDHLIHRNWIHHTGLAPYWHSAAVTLYGSGHNRITLNYIHDVPYCGVAITGTYSQDINSIKRASGHTDAYGRFEAQYKIRWDKLPEGSEERYRANTGTFDLPTLKKYLNSGDNLIEHNICNDVMLKLHDGGALYSWSCGLHNVWRRNAVRHKHGTTKLYPLYLDDEVDQCVMEDNVVFGPGKIMNNNRCQNKWINNTVSTERTPAYDILLKEILDLAEKEGGWLGNPSVPK